MEIRLLLSTLIYSTIVEHPDICYVESAFCSGFVIYVMKSHTFGYLREFSHLEVTKIDVVFSVGYTS
ncbi:hypothetical protein SAMN05878443_2147 [Carnobacterium alterfunditum]|uniref:Uncharacterized protein n=1 Tax=Carnobacterium alterfunditum TaxID=28230 RepID=A0A1N6HX27_9LACT|nr:hypothetical protein SAMN05878443_2147 [Carnobacterium alterfunditum]